jgi:hypothetical protein
VDRSKWCWSNRYPQQLRDDAYHYQYLQMSMHQATVVLQVRVGVEVVRSVIRHTWQFPQLINLHAMIAHQ